MPRLLTSLVVITCCASSPAAFQTRGGTQTAKPPAVSACSLLTRDLIRKVTPEDAPALRILLLGEPDADSTGAGGSDCTDGGITIQIDPMFSFATYKKQPDWGRAESVPGVGDEALFHDNNGLWAEFVVRSGPHVLTIRMSVPNGKTAAAIKPNVVMLAKELLPKLK